MTEEEFSELSARVLLGEASEEDRALHERSCAEDPALAETFEAIKVASGLLKENAPLASAMDADETEIPEPLLEELVSEVTGDEQSEEMPQEASGRKSNKIVFFGLPLAAAAAFAVVFFSSRSENPQGNGPLARPDGPTPAQPHENPLVLASIDVEFGHWKGEVLRDVNPEDDWLPQWVKTSAYETKTERQSWLDSSVKAIRVWINDDEGKIMILRPDKKIREAIDLVVKPDERKQQIIKLLESLKYLEENDKSTTPPETKD
jgi:hypothetical protein